MQTILQKIKGAKPASKQAAPSFGSGIVKTSYTSIPVEIPQDFLAPLPDPSLIKTEVIDFANSPLPEYKKCYAVVLDNVLSQEECNMLLHMAEQSAGGHRDDPAVANNGWKPAMINAGPGHEYFHPGYRNSDRIVWDQELITERLKTRVFQVKEIQEYLSTLEGEKYYPVIGDSAIQKGVRWVITKQGINERMRFLKYGAGQYFRRMFFFSISRPIFWTRTDTNIAHCDGPYYTPDGTQETFFTIHFYFNDSAQEMEKEEGYISLDDKPSDLLRGGATTFHSRDEKRRIDVDPKAGRVLIFQHKRLYHSGDDVVSGTKYTMRSDILYEFEADSDEEDNVTFG